MMGCVLFTTEMVTTPERNVAKFYKFTFFQSDPLEKLMREFCKREKINYENVIFQFDGETIQSHQTSETLGLEDGDCVDVIEI